MTFCGKFIFEIDRGIETGDYNIILHAITKYKGLINDAHIKMAQEIYEDLLYEKFEQIII